MEVDQLPMVMMDATWLAQETRMYGNALIPLFKVANSNSKFAVDQID